VRYFLEFSYNGTDYHGWQVQPNAITVQSVLDKALSILLKKPTTTMGAGRTDTGVHAAQMVAHFDTETSIDTEDLSYKLNSFLPKTIAIHNIKQVHADAHARFDATQRTYRYKITTFKDVFNFDNAYYYTKNLDINLMNEASTILLEYSDFKCFSRAHSDVKTHICALTEAFWIKNEHELIFQISADRFLRNMVRAIVGTLLDIGNHKTSLEDFHNIIQFKDRSNAGASAPAKGLYLTKIVYPDSIYDVKK
jgi:tRNA pseudouridine38-40 synthase